MYLITHAILIMLPIYLHEISNITTPMNASQIRVILQSLSYQQICNVLVVIFAPVYDINISRVRVTPLYYQFRNIPNMHGQEVMQAVSCIAY